MKKKILIGSGVLVLVVSLGLLLRGGEVEVAVVTTTPDTLSVTIPAEGRTRARDRFTVTAPAAGRVSRVRVEIGDMVEAGQVLTRLFPAPDDPRTIATTRAEVDAARARYTEAEARLREAELQALQAEREAERRRPLLEMGAITRESMEQTELAAVVANERLDSARAAREAARAALGGAQARLLGAEGSDEGVSSMEITAPASGRVVSIPDRSERVIAAGTPVVELAETAGMEVVLDILSEDAVAVAPGNEVVITGWGGATPLRGEVRTVTLVGYTKVSALGVEEQRVDVLVDLHAPPEALGIGYRVSGDIVVWRGEHILTIPTSASFRGDDSWHVFVVADGVARERPVVLGQRNESAAEVLGGLSEGEQVIVFPPEDLEDGTRVRTSTGP